MSDLLGAMGGGLGVGAGDVDPAAAPPNAPADKLPPFYGQGKSDTLRDDPNPDEARRALVTERCAAIREDKRCWAKAFKKMSWDLKFVAGRNQYVNQTPEDQRYMVNLVYRHIRHKTGSIYAKNPTPVAKLKQKLRYQVWDGRPETLIQCQQILSGQMAANPIQIMQCQQIMADAAAGQRQIQMLTKVAKTLEIIIKYFMDEQEPSFKRGMKRVVRRGKSIGVGYVRLDYKRVMAQDPTVAQGLADMSQQLQHLERLRADMMDKTADPNSADAEMLKQQMASLLSRPDIVLREGLQFDFPSSLRVIPHAACEQIDGFVGADWVTVEHPLTPKRVQEIYKIDLGKNFTPYKAGSDGGYKNSKTTMNGGVQNSYGDGVQALVWEHYHRPSGLKFVLCDGYPDYLAPPEQPVTDLERFYPIFAYVPNEIEEEDNIFPLSDSQLLKSVQQEYNRTREALRAHRYASRPLYLAAGYAFPVAAEEDDTMKSMVEHKAHEIIKIPGMTPGEDAGKLVVPLKKVEIDPKVYETESIYADSQRAVGSSQVDYGGTSGDTATEVAASRQVIQTDDADDIDSLDMMLSDLFAAAGKVCFKEVPQDMAKQIAGAGAVWPQLSRQEIAEEVMLDIQGGSTGRPNAAQEIANLERLTPIIVQVPGIAPLWLAEKAVQLLDPTTDLGDALASQMPSITSLNAYAAAQATPQIGGPGQSGGQQGGGAQPQPGTGNPATEPTAQGAQGGNNAPAAPQRQMGSQPQFPTGAPRLQIVGK